MRLYLDDLRKTGDRTKNPDSFDTRAYTAAEAIAYLKTGLVTHISLDHDLGGEDDLPEEICGNGYQVACWIEENIGNGVFTAEGKRIAMPTWEIHSMNPVGARNMRSALENAERMYYEYLKALSARLIAEVLAEDEANG